MWYPRTAPPARRGIDPERDKKFESGFLQRRVTNEPSSASSARGKAAFRMVSSRSFGNDHLIDRLAAGIAGAAGRISTDSLRSRPALFYPSIRALRWTPVVRQPEPIVKV